MELKKPWLEFEEQRNIAVEAKHALTKAKEKEQQYYEKHIKPLEDEIK
jgi:hypothetical protein